jgi:hypothetical protein
VKSSAQELSSSIANFSTMTKRSWLFGALGSALLLACACQAATETIVQLDSDPATVAAAKSLRVRACSQDDKLVLDKLVTLGSANIQTLFPATIPLEPAGDDASRRFTLLAEVFNGNGQRLSWQRVIGGYVDHESTSIKRSLASLCNETVICEANQTCSDGNCVPALAAPAKENELPCDPLTACAKPPCNEPSPYPVGFVWKRSVDWKPGTTLGRTIGNPMVDAVGRPAWSFETVSGNLSAPWYAQPRRLMIWDNSFFGNNGSWAFADELAPAASDRNFDHPMDKPAVPVMRWQNPTGLQAIVKLKGNIALLAQMAGPNPAPVDVVVAVSRPTSDGIKPIVEMSVPFTGVNANLPVDLPAVTVGAKDSLMFAIRGNGKGGWITAIDDVTITLQSTSRPPVRGN